MKSLCKSLSAVVLFSGTIGSIVAAYTFGNRLDYATLSVARDVPQTITIVVTSLFFTFLCAFTLSAISVILENQEKILETITPTSGQPQSMPFIITPAATFQNLDPVLLKSEKEHCDNEEELKMYGAWKCKKCKRINNGEVCNCGATKTESQ